ncbi:hypothetical protein ACHAXS_011902 [Conticribra weissflogii]
MFPSDWTLQSTSALRPKSCAGKMGCKAERTVSFLS